MFASNFTLTIDGVDFSDYIQQETDIAETMRKVIGEAQADAVDGTTIPDLIKIKWDPSFLLAPMPKSKMQTLIALMEKESVALEYTSVKTADMATRPITAIPTAMQVKFATRWNGEHIYDATPISFEEV